MKIDGLDIEVVSDLKDYGYRDDGTPFIGELIFVEVTNARGDRWRHQTHFPGVRVEVDEEGYNHFVDTRGQANAWANYLVEKIKLRGEINLQYWNPARPVYGSDAYIEYGQDADIMLEKEEG